MHLSGALGEITLQRLFSTFPGGRPGAGLLLLRLAVGLAAIVQGVLYLSAPISISVGCWLLGIVTILSGVALTVGCLTPIAAVLIAALFLGSALSWLPAAPESAHMNVEMAAAVVIVAAALVLLGPGALSVDGRLFGRREILIPPPSHKPEA